MKEHCKFCGKELNVEKYLTPQHTSCGECTSFCMKQCEIASKTTTSWHKEPCISCDRNPYKIRHKWNGERWVENAV